jgi:hypothetical protein
MNGARLTNSRSFEVFEVLDSGTYEGNLYQLTVANDVDVRRRIH